MISSVTRSAFLTATWKLCWAERPSRSRAVTVMVAIPLATAVTVTVLPDIDAVALAGPEEAAAYVSSSPSGSSK